MKLKIKIIIMLFVSTSFVFGRLPKNNSGNISEDDTASFVGKKISPEFNSWKDENSGYEITQWTSNGSSSHPYFTINSFIDEENVLIFSKRSGKKQLYKLNLTSGVMIQITNLNRLRNIEHLPDLKTVWLFDEKNLISLNTETLETNEIFNFEDFPYSVGSFTVTCDGKWFVFSSNRKEQKDGDCEYGPYEIYKLNLIDKSISPIIHITGFNIGHLQANPVDPNLILYCWQWEALGRQKLVGDTPIRMWWINIDGTDGGPLKQAFGLHATHEAWSPDGKFVTYSGDFRFGLQKGREILGFQSFDGTVNKMYDASVWHAHQTIFKDNKHWISDLYNHDDRKLVMFTRGEDKMEKEEILFEHGSSWDGQDSHPHPRFSPNGKYILFSTDKTGDAQVYTVKVNLEKIK
ncbi:MAG: PD40 domain-containing protein [Ignavibacteriae bacterium]|nr:PD40 domain-containing protein [Ignavibacteriota bacterium]